MVSISFAMLSSLYVVNICLIRPHHREPKNLLVFLFPLSIRGLFCTNFTPIILSVNTLNISVLFDKNYYF